jgi:hypothetical protein
MEAAAPMTLFTSTPENLYNFFILMQMISIKYKILLVIFEKYKIFYILKGCQIYLLSLDLHSFVNFIHLQKVGGNFSLGPCLAEYRIHLLSLPKRKDQN